MEALSSSDNPGRRRQLATISLPADVDATEPKRAKVIPKRKDTVTEEDVARAEERARKQNNEAVLVSERLRRQRGVIEDAISERKTKLTEIRNMKNSILASKASLEKLLKVAELLMSQLVLNDQLEKGSSIRASQLLMIDEISHADRMRLNVGSVPVSHNSKLVNAKSVNEDEQSGSREKSEGYFTKSTLSSNADSITLTIDPNESTANNEQPPPPPPPPSGVVQEDKEKEEKSVDKWDPPNELSPLSALFGHLREECWKAGYKGKDQLLVYSKEFEDLMVKLREKGAFIVQNKITKVKHHVLLLRTEFKTKPTTDTSSRWYFKCANLNCWKATTEKTRSGQCHKHNQCGGDGIQNGGQNDQVQQGPSGLVKRILLELDDNAQPGPSVSTSGARKRQKKEDDPARGPAQKKKTPSAVEKKKTPKCPNRKKVSSSVEYIHDEKQSRIPQFFLTVKK